MSWFTFKAAQSVKQDGFLLQDHPAPATPTAPTTPNLTGTIAVGALFTMGVLYTYCKNPKRTKRG